MGKWDDPGQIPVTLPEDSPAFKDWERRRQTGETPEPVELPSTDIPEPQLEIPERDWDEQLERNAEN